MSHDWRLSDTIVAFMDEERLWWREAMDEAYDWVEADQNRYADECEQERHDLDELEERL